MECLIKYLIIYIFIVFDSEHCLESNGDQIDKLPGLNTPPFRQYSGYLDIRKGRHFHYWLVESQSKPSTNPLILWLHGGTATCSSVGGFWEETGPFKMERNGTIVANPYSWNTVANVLYIESPVGVGYSYSDNENTEYTDDATAEDNYLALKRFFEKYPKFVNHSFYIAGGSYAAIDVPLLALKIYRNKANINLKGLAIHNGNFDSKILTNSKVPMAYSHGLISSNEYNDLVQKCCQYTSSGQVCDFGKNSSNSCDLGSLILDRITENGIDIYSIYSECIECNECNDSSHYYSSDSPYIHDLNTYFGIEKTNIEPYAQTHESNDDCPSYAYRAYLNSPEVRKALHIPESVHKWRICNYDLKVTQQYWSMKSQIKELIRKYKIPKFIIFNGDVDLVCDFIGNQQFVDELGFKLMEKSKKWTVDGRTSGLVKRYAKGLSFMTVRLAGHLAIAEQPKACLAIIRELIGISNVD